MNSYQPLWVYENLNIEYGILNIEVVWLTEIG